MLNIYKPDFATRMRLYLKPRDGSLSIMFILLITDTFLSLAYIWAQFRYVINGSYRDSQDKIVQMLVAFGVSGVIMLYVIADASRFLKTWPDRILYFLSCLLQKQILLPILLPGSCFKSYVATKEFDPDGH